MLKWPLHILHYIIVINVACSLGHFATYQNCISPKPNIIVIMADDLGWNDISLHGSDQIPTPNIDALGIYGISFKRNYVPPMCTPSRSSLMTGKFPIHTGMHHFVIPSDEPWGLSPDEKILPQYLKEAGYVTNLIGKWHLGMFRKEYNPYRRGFDDYIGYLGPYIDYYDHSLIMLNRNYSRGYDMRHKETADYSRQGQYATDMFTDVAVEKIMSHDKKDPLFLLLSHLAPHTANEDVPLQAPQEYINKFSYIQNPKRRTFAAMMYSLDQGVGRVMKALKDSNMLDNSIVLFYADNGAPTIGQHANSGSNFPLRGQKDSQWEGAVRSASVLFSPLLKRRQYVSGNLYHLTDWMRTFVNLAGGHINENTENLSGIDIWNSLTYDIPSFRRDIVHNIDDIYGYASYEKDGYKYIEGTRFAQYDSWLGEIPLEDPNHSPKLNYPDLIRNSESGKVLEKYSQCISGLTGARCRLTDAAINSFRQKARLVCPVPLNTTYTACMPTKTEPCLFNIIADPCEYINLAKFLPVRTQYMKTAVNNLRTTVVAPRNRPSDPNCDPRKWNGLWTWWQDMNM